MYCEHRDIFGKPGEGVHAYRLPLVDLAAVDVLFTIVFAIIIWVFIGHSFLIIMATLFASGILAHRMFGVATKVDLLLFGPPQCS